MKAKPQAWSNEEVEYLKLITPGNSYKEITRMMNEKFGTTRTEKGVSSTIKRFELKNGIDARFQKNHDSFNKGVPMASWMSPESMERIKATQFQRGGKGQKRGRDRKPGEERVSKGGYIEVRLDHHKRVWNYDNGHVASRWWEFKHVLIWEEHHKQKVPDGHVVIFTDGNNRNFDIDNLILVSRNELLKLNQNKLIFKGNTELTKTGINIAKLMIAKNKRRNKNEKHTSRLK